MHAVILMSFEDLLVRQIGADQSNAFAIEYISSVHEHSFILEDTE